MMRPVCPNRLCDEGYDEEKLAKFDKLIEGYHFPWTLREILPKSLTAGEEAGVLTAAGAKLLDPTGTLEAGIPLCPPEGDAGTGMVATNSVKIRTGNVSAGTSVFAMIVMEKELQKLHTEIDLVTTPAGDLVAMVHCNNCTSDINAWVNLFGEFAAKMGMPVVDKGKLYDLLFKVALEGEPDCGGLLSYNYFSGESITGFDEGRPLFVRHADDKLSLANFMRAHLFTALGALKNGLDILLKEENVPVDKIYGHGGLLYRAGGRSEDHGSSDEYAGFRDGYGKRGRCLGHCRACSVHGRRSRRGAGRLSGSSGICRSDRNDTGAGSGRR